MSKSFDVLGSKEKAVAIVEIREGEDEEEIADYIMDKNNNIKSVLKKESKRTGEFRTREYTLIRGDEDTGVLHKEHGYLIKIDPRKSYFSPRESTERQRVAKSVQPGEIVMLMFAGVGPYSIAIAKKQPDVKKIIAIELNPDAVEYMKYNVRINKLSHKIKPIEGDVKEAAKDWYNKCDRIIMPLPLDAGDFLDVATKFAKKGATIHFYGWGNEADGDVFAHSKEVIENKMDELNLEYDIKNERTVLPYAPGRFKVCIEFKII